MRLGDKFEYTLECHFVKYKAISHEEVRACGVRLFFFSSRRRHTRLQGDWSSDVCSSDLGHAQVMVRIADYGQNPQAASDGPRYRIVQGLEVSVESGFAPAVLDNLARRGDRKSVV